MLTRLLKFNSLNAYSWLKEAACVLTVDLAVGFFLALFQSGSSAAAPVFWRQYSLVNSCPFSVEGGNLVLFNFYKLFLCIQSGLTSFFLSAQVV